MDEEDLFCANCGTENPSADAAAKRLTSEAEYYRFECKSCGASMSYDASAQSLRCPFCGSTQMESGKVSRTIRPHAVVRFEVDQRRAETLLRGWLQSGFWRPRDVARVSKLGKVTAVYVPYWAFNASTDTIWTADSSPAPFGSRGDWYPVSGRNHASYHGILIAGSSILTNRETEAIAPSDISQAVPPEQIDLKNSIFEEYRVPRKLARPLARSAIEQLELQACASLVPNRHRNVRVNVRIHSMRGHPILLPVWIVAYRYKSEVHRVLINGQTGKICGSAPFSYWRLWLVLLWVAVGMAAAIAIYALRGG